MLTLCARRLCLAFWLVSLAAVPCAHAQTGDAAARAAARELAEGGIEAFQAAKYAEAHDKLEKSYQLFATPTLGLWSARAKVQLGQWVEAAERYRETLTLSDSVGNQAAQREALRDAQTELKALVPRIPTLTVELEGARADEVKLTLDGAALSNAFINVARPTNPGAHEISAEHNSERARAAVTLREGDRHVLPIQLGSSKAHAEPTRPEAAGHAPAPPEAATPSPAATTLAAGSPLTPADPQLSTAAAAPAALQPGRAHWVPVGVTAIALGGGGLVTAAVTYAIAVDVCPSAECHSKADQSKYDGLQAASTWSFWPGAILAAGGAASLWFGLRKPPEREHVRLDIVPGGLSVRGTF